MSYLNQIYKLNIMNGMWRLLIICPCGVYWLLIYINNGWNQPIGIWLFSDIIDLIHDCVSPRLCNTTSGHKAMW